MITRKTVDRWLPLISSGKGTAKQVASFWRNATAEQKKAVIQYCNKCGIDEPVRFVFVIGQAIS